MSDGLNDTKQDFRSKWTPVTAGSASRLFMEKLIRESEDPWSTVVLTAEELPCEHYYYNSTCGVCVRQAQDQEAYVAWCIQKGVRY